MQHIIRITYQTAIQLLFVLCAVSTSYAAGDDAQKPAGNESKPDNTNAPAVNATQPQQDRLNIILIMADDLGRSDLGSYGSALNNTPNIDQLARDGMRFTDAYSSGPNCSPTRACLMTGLYVTRHGIFTVKSSRRGDVTEQLLMPPKNKTILALRFTTIAEVLREAGYSTALIGKWHLGKPGKNGPQEQGFDINIGGHLLGYPISYFSPYDNPTITDGPDGEFLTERLTNEAISYIRAHKSEPFFLYMPHYAVHTPHEAPQELIDRFAAAHPELSEEQCVYGAMVESFDTSVGRVVDTLKDLDLYERTLIMVYSDNGSWYVESSGPLRSAKGTLYEGGIRVPLIVRWPGLTKAGSTCAEPVQSIDFFPTIVEAARVTNAPVVDGLSMVPILGDPVATLDRDAIFWHFPAYLPGFPGEEIFRTTPSGVIRMGSWKLIEAFTDNSVELFNLTDDLGESTNLAETEPEKMRELLNRLHTWRRQNKAPMPKPNPLAKWMRK